jgi:putative transposase
MTDYRRNFLAGGSFFHRMVKLGVYPEDWAGDPSNDVGDFGD